MICESCFVEPSDGAIECDACNGDGYFRGVTKHAQVQCGSCSGKGQFERCNKCLGIFKPTIKVKLLEDDARLPSRATPGSVGFDLYAVKAVYLPKGFVRKIPLGIALELPEGTWAQICPRSGMASKGLVGIVGTIDTDYRGEIAALIMNISDCDRSVKVGDRVAQLVLHQAQDFVFDQAGEIDETERGVKGFGSSGS